MKLDTEAAELVTKAQNMISGVKQMFPEHQAVEGPWTISMNKDSVICDTLWLLGRKIPRAARAGRTQEARDMLCRVQGMLLGVGVISHMDVGLITDYPPVRPPNAKPRRLTSL